MNLEMALVIRCPLSLTSNMKGHLVTLVEIHVHLILGISGHICLEFIKKKDRSLKLL